MADYFSKLAMDLHPELPPQVVSTGLTQILAPVVSGALGRVARSR